MKIRIISPQRVRKSFVLNGESEYLKRSKKFQIELLDGFVRGLSASMSPEQVIAKEEAGILDKLRPGADLWVLDDEARQYKTTELAQKFQTLMSNGVSSLDCVIGGPHGISASLIAKANETVSLGKITLPFQLCRLVWIEQLYRIESILSGTSYHKE